jgi:hypothetical protein
MGREAAARAVAAAMRTFALLAVLALSAVGAASAEAPPFTVTTSFSPTAIRYGDPVTAVVEVRFDPKRVDHSSISAVPSFAPFVLVAKPVVEAAGAGLLRFRYSLLCVTEGCLPVRASKVIRLRPFRVTAGGATAIPSWPLLRIESRLSAADLRGEAPFRSPAAPPPPHYRVGPGALATGLIVSAVICALVAIVLVAAAVWRRRRRPVTRRVSPLELAIAYVRDAAGRPDPDRRRALELLSEAVEDDLALAAADAAWSREPPTPAGAGDLADRAEGQR